MVTRTVIRITSSEVEHWAAIAAAVDNNAAAIEKIENKQSESSKNTTSPSATLDQDKEKSKRPLPLWRDNTNDQSTMNRQWKKKNCVAIDLSDVPPQPPIPKSSGRVKEGASKYTGVSFDKQNNRWVSQINLDGKKRFIGYYVDEEDAAVDYARAVFKYRRDRREAKRQLKSFATVDLSDVPPQPPIPKSIGRVKEGASKYTGVCFNKLSNKWQASINFDGKFHYIGCYDDEMEAAVDYARALFKYKGGVNRRRQKKSLVIDLSDVPPQQPIFKSSRRVKEGASKYTGVTFNKQCNRWIAQIMIEGKQHAIGHYDNEEDAAIDYARAVFKYKGGVKDGGVKDSFVIDLSDVPPQPPIPKSSRRVKEGVSKYTGVSFIEKSNKWFAKIYYDGKQRSIGFYDDEEEAAVDYARAVFKYKGGKVHRRQKKNSFVIDLSGVPPQPPIPRSSGRTKEGASKYTGVTFNKQSNRWVAQIHLDGKLRYIGYYDDEEDAAVDYARAVFKYKREVTQQRKSIATIDLSDVPPLPPIPKSKGYVKEGASTYAGVTFNKRVNTPKWQARIFIDGTQQVIGLYDNEEEAAVDYARAVFKYKSGVKNQK